MNAEQRKQQFRDQGQSVADWARQHGYAPKYVYAVLNGFLRGHRGKAHDIAVKLQLKPQPPQQS